MTPNIEEGTRDGRSNFIYVHDYNVNLMPSDSLSTQSRLLTPTYLQELPCIDGAVYGVAAAAANMSFQELGQDEGRFLALLPKRVRSHQLPGQIARLQNGRIKMSTA